MNIKKLEKLIQEITGDKNFKVDIGREYIEAVTELESIIYKIAKINDAIGDVEFVKSYYSDIFNTNKKYLNFIANCDDLNYSLEKRRNELISQFKDFIEEICKKDELLDLFKEDLFNLNKILKEVKKENCIIGISKIISYLEQWLDIISYEEMNGNILELLNDELKDFYEEIFSNEELCNNERTRSN